MAFEQFLAGVLGPQNPSAPMSPGGFAQLPMEQTQAPAPAQGPQQSIQGAPGGAAPDFTQFLTMLMQSLSSQQAPNSGMGDLAALAKVLRPDPLGEVARSNSRPGGFTPQAAWDAWGPGANRNRYAQPSAPAAPGAMPPALAPTGQPTAQPPVPSNMSMAANTNQPFDLFNLFGR